MKVKPIFEIEQNEYVCSECNAFLREYMKICPKCKKEIDWGVKISTN